MAAPERDAWWRRRRAKNAAMFWLLIGLMVLFFVVTIVRFDEQLRQKSPAVSPPSGRPPSGGSISPPEPGPSAKESPQ